MAANAQTARELYLSAPTSVLNKTAEQRTSSIASETATHLKLTLTAESNGEFKLVYQAKGESIVGLTTSNCDASDLRFWSVRGDKWSDATKRVIKPLGKSDVVEILKASPAEISSLEQKIEIAYFYKFAADTNSLELIARKQGSCDIAGTVYNYAFDGKRYTRK